MKRRARMRGRWLSVLLALCAVGVGMGLWAAQPRAPGAADSVFTPAHRSIPEAAGHFFGLRSRPVQPIPFPHRIHFANEVSCVTCHAGVEQNAVAGIPGVNTCMGCHAGIAEDKELIIKITEEYYDKGIDLPWQRVYGWNDEAHVRFNHAPHVRSGVDCAMCHGDLSKMTVAERAVEHTMSFCVDCHQERKASTDCLTCHY